MTSRHPVIKLWTENELRAGILNLLGSVLAIGMCAVGIPFLFFVELRATPVALAGFQAASGSAGVASGVLFGILVDKYPKFPYTVMFPTFGIGTCVAMVLLAVATGTPMALIAGVCMGLSGSAMLLLRKRMMSRFTMSEMARVQPVVMGIVSLLMLALPSVGAGLSEFSLRLPFLVASIFAGGMASISGLTSLYICYTTDGERQEVLANLKRPPKKTEHSRVHRNDLVLSAHLLLSMPIFMTGDFSTMSVKMYVLINRLRMSPASIALQMTCVVVAGGLISIAVFRPLLKLLGPFYLVIAGALVNVGGAFIMANVQSVSALVPALACDVIATQFVNNSTALLIKGCVPKAYQGRAIAFQSTLLQSGQMLAPALGALVFSINPTFPWYLVKIPLSTVAFFVNVSMMLFARRIGSYDSLVRLKGRDEVHETTSQKIPLGSARAAGVLEQNFPATAVPATTIAQPARTEKGRESCQRAADEVHASHVESDDAQLSSAPANSQATLKTSATISSTEATTAAHIAKEEVSAKTEKETIVKPISLLPMGYEQFLGHWTGEPRPIPATEKKGVEAVIKEMGVPWAMRSMASGMMMKKVDGFTFEIDSNGCFSFVKDAEGGKSPGAVVFKGDGEVIRRGEPGPPQNGSETTVSFLAQEHRATFNTSTQMFKDGHLTTLIATTRYIVDGTLYETTSVPGNSNASFTKLFVKK